MKEKSEFPKVTLKGVLFEWNDTDELMDRLRADGRRIGADRVAWVLDWAGENAPRASKRFTAGSRELQALQERGELDPFD